MITEFDFDEFIRDFYKKDELKKFILRVRDNNDKNNNEKEEDKASNIAYYDGIKAFDVKKYYKKAKLEFPVNVYKCNTTDVRKNEEAGQIKEYKENKINLMNEMSKISTFIFKKITFEINKKSKNIDEYDKNMKKFKEFVETRGYTFQIPKIDLEQEKKYTIEFSPIIESNTIVNINEPKDIVEMQCEYIKLLKLKNNDQTITKSDKFFITIEYNKNVEFSTFIKIITTGISNYKTLEKLEKKYQHYFMLNANGSKTLFPRKDGEIVTHFEQEYGIINHNPIIGEIEEKNEKGYKTGRVDCIFYKYKPITEKIFNVSDIYLIEIKVDNTVILGKNGVMTHLEDIKAFLDYKKDDNPPKYDIETLKERIKYRNNVLFGSEETEFNEIKIHFYTVVGFTKEQERKTVSDNIKGLCKEDFVKTQYKKLVEVQKNVTLYSIAPDKSQCDIKFFFEKPLFEPKSGKISADFEDVTKELTPYFI